MVSIPAIEDALFVLLGTVRTWWNGLCVVVGFPCGTLEVEGLKVHCAARLAVLFGAHHHAMTPGHRIADRHRLEHTQGNVLVKTSFDLRLPV